jgi:hypothetical protein
LPIANFYFPFTTKSAIGNLAIDNDLLLAGRLLLGDGGATWSFTCAGIRVRSLATDRQRTTMSQAAIATDIHQSLDVHLNALAQIAFNLTLHFQNATNATQLVFTQISHARVEIDISKTNLGSLVGR